MSRDVLPYNKSLDGLRALAVLFVLAAHFPAVQGLGASHFLKAAASGLHIGYLGVDIFFILSGFLITSILAREKQAGTFSFLRFYKKRALRIFPIFYLSLVAVYFLFDLPLGEFLANAFYVSNYFYTFDGDPSPLRHTWSLSVEEQFYLFWPLVVALCPAAKMNRLIVAGLGFVLLLTTAIAVTLLDPELFNRFTVRALPYRMLSLGIGAYLALNPHLFERVRLKFVVLALLSCPVLILSLYGVEHYAGPLLELFVMSAWSLSIFLLVFVGAKRNMPVLRPLFESAPLVYIGRISYGLYLYHYIVLYGIGVLAKHASVGFPATQVLFALVATFAIASASFHIIEKPFLRMKNRLPVKPGRAAAELRQ